MQKLIFLLAVAVGITVMAATALGATRTVSVKDNFFSPKSLTVKKNTTVNWIWRGSNRHDVRVSKGPVVFKSAIRRSGSFSKKMTRKGTYKLFCSLHGSSMRMTLTVN